MSFYRRKPSVLEAFRWTDDRDQTADPEWIISAINTGKVWFADAGTPWVSLMIESPHFPSRRAKRGDWIVREVDGELYPCSPDIFAQTFEEAAQ